MGNVESFKIRNACGPKGCRLRPTALVFTGFFLILQTIFVLISIAPLFPAYAQKIPLEYRSYQVYFIFMVLYLNLYVLAFVGVFLRMKELLLPWLLIQGSFIVLLFVTASAFFIVIEYAMFAIIIGAFNLYHWVIIHSYYHRLSLDYVPSATERAYNSRAE